MNIRNHPIWHIAGIGAIGTLVAGKFYQGGVDAHLILKNEQQLAAYQDCGLTILTDQTVINSYPSAIELERFATEPIQYLLCCVKAYDVTQLLMRLRHNLNAQSVIILIHNGLGVLDEIKAHLPQLRIISGISTVGAYLEKKYTARSFLNGKFYLGQAAGSFSPQEIKTISTAFDEARLPFQWEDDIHSIIWEKFAVNCSINMLTALFTCKNGDLLHHEELLQKITYEIAQVSEAYGFHLSAADLFHRVKLVIQNTADNYSSMYKDVQNNKQTEIHYLNEHLIKLAQLKTITVPLNSILLKEFHTKFS